MSSQPKKPTDLDLARRILSRVSHRPEVMATVLKLIEQLQPCRHSKDFASVVWRGEPYSFTATQAAAVKLLWTAWEAGTPIMRHETVLVEIGSDADRLADIFKGHPAWMVMLIQGDVKGTVRLS